MIQLYSVGVLAKKAGLPARSLRHWASEEKPQWGYVEPYAIALRAADTETFMKLWHPDQVEAVKEGYAKYQKRLADQKIETKRRRKAYLESYNAEYYKKKLARVGKEVKPRTGKKPGPKPKPMPLAQPNYTYKPLDEEAKVFIKEFDKELEDKAMAWLTKNP